MFRECKPFKSYTTVDKNDARKRYLTAISTQVCGSAKVFLKRKVKDMFVNGFNPTIMRLHRANMDMQMLVPSMYVDTLRKMKQAYRNC